MKIFSTTLPELIITLIKSYMSVFANVFTAESNSDWVHTMIMGTYRVFDKYTPSYSITHVWIKSSIFQILHPGA